MTKRRRVRGPGDVLEAHGVADGLAQPLAQLARRRASAARRAGSRRGCSTSDLARAGQARLQQRRGTRVVLPAPGGASITSARLARRCPTISGSSGSMGSGARRRGHRSGGHGSGKGLGALAALQIEVEVARPGARRSAASGGGSLAPARPRAPGRRSSSSVELCGVQALAELDLEVRGRDPGCGPNRTRWKLDPGPPLVRRQRLTMAVRSGRRRRPGRAHDVGVAWGRSRAGRSEARIGWLGPTRMRARSARPAR